MANTNAPYGLRAVRHASGGNVQTNKYTIASGYAASIYLGDPLIMAADGSLTIAVGTAGTPSPNCIGSFAGCEYVDASGNQKFSKYWPASTTATNIVAYVYDDPDIIFSIQTDATGATAADVGQLVDVEIVAGSALTGKSGTNLDMSTGGGTTGKQLRILRLVDNGLNESGAYTQVEVMWAEHALKGVVSGVGGI